jgi:hypothetical protein
MWQFYNDARPKKPGGPLRISEKDEDGERKTRRIEDGCIFLNRKGHEAEGFTGSFGCVLHHVAQRDGKHFADTKPDVCWQLPLRRSFETREYGEREYSVTVIGEYERLAWGDGGEDFDWYCTSNSDAHVGTEPVYVSNKYELELLMGKDAYNELARLCDVRMTIEKRQHDGRVRERQHNRRAQRHRLQPADQHHSSRPSHPSGLQARAKGRCRTG